MGRARTGQYVLPVRRSPLSWLWLADPIRNDAKDANDAHEPKAFASVRKKRSDQSQLLISHQSSFVSGFSSNRQTEAFERVRDLIDGISPRWQNKSLDCSATALACGGHP